MSIAKKFQLSFFIIFIIVFAGFLSTIHLFNRQFKSFYFLLTEVHDVNRFLNTFHEETQTLKGLNDSKIGFDYKTYVNRKRTTDDMIERFYRNNYSKRISRMELEHALLNSYEVYRINAEELIRLFYTEEKKSGKFISAYYTLQAQAEYLHTYALNLLTESISYGETFFYAALSNYKYVFKLIICIAGIMFAFVVFSAYLLKKNFITPVVILDKHAKEIINGNYDAKVDMPNIKSGEMLRLVKTFDEMKTSLGRTFDLLNEKAEIEKTLRRKEVEYEKMQKYAERMRFARLQSQIRPHFFFNCLNTLSSLAIMEDAPSCRELCGKLAAFFRYTLENTEEIVSLKEELDIVQIYMDIQKCRFGGRIKLEMERGAAEDMPIPKFSIQPLVENSVVHGFARKEENASVQIKITQGKRGRIEIRVIDNGSGFDTGLLKEVSHSVGLQNIRERLAIFDPRGTFDIQSEKGKGTVVCISLKRK